MKNLQTYDNSRFGPLLGVSDEGSAAKTIADAAHKSAKARALGEADEMCVGVIIDGERMGSAGEVPIGPDEYRQILPVVKGRTFCSTNVGVRVNTRFLQPLPEFVVADAKADEAAWIESVFAKFHPFIDTPDGEPRPLTVRLVVSGPECSAALRHLVPKLYEGRKSGLLGPSDLHRLSLLCLFSPEMTPEKQAWEIRQLLKLAEELDVPEVAIDGKLREAARRRMSIQGLLNVLDPDVARTLLGEAKSLGVKLAYHYELDPESAARTIWTGLDSARQCGLTAAKFGLFPLTYAQQEHVVAQIMCWMADWTAIPAFYVDTAIVTDDDVFEPDRCVESARMWMTMVRGFGARVVLVDCPDRIEPHRLLRSGGGPEDPGILELDQVETLQRHADELGLKVLWSGGIKPDQAFALARLGVAGIFTTGSTARLVPVAGALVGDKQLPAGKEPTDVGVRRIHALVQAGFLCRVLDDAAITASIEERAGKVYGNTKGDELRKAIDALDEVLVNAWTTHWASSLAVSR
jgi:hypothetical protein